jgi:hypothetical protein
VSQISEEDHERAHATLFGSGTYETRITQLIAEVRRETREATIRECAEHMATASIERADRYQAARHVLALATPPSAPAAPKCGWCRGELNASLCLVCRGGHGEPQESKCKVCCGPKDGHVSHQVRVNWPFHDFEPEEPGHG